MTNTSEVNKLVDHLFRRESGKMVAVLTRLFGVHNLELAEDVVQDTLQQALSDWKKNSIPPNPEGWLMLVAKRKAINLLRRERYTQNFADDIDPFLKSEWTLSYTIDNVFLETEIKDSQLRMIFTCCHPKLARESQLALTLKTLCGFSIKEIANALLTTESTINKRLYRAKEKIRNGDVGFEVPLGNELLRRLESVYLTIYLLFNEGYNSSTDDTVIRKDLCSEAMRLALLLTEKPLDAYPKTHALLALMCFHAARFDSRIDDKGCILILEEQDRSLWNQELIATGIDFLNKSAKGNHLSSFHLEASIALQHCLAKSFEETNWQQIYVFYDKLYEIKPSPVIQLNKAIITGRIHGPEEAVIELHRLENDKALANYYLLPASLGEFYLQLKDLDKAKTYFEKAKKLTSSKAENELLDRKLKF